MPARIDLTHAALALGHPIRRKILQQLAEGFETPNDMAKALGVKLGVLSYHVRMLADYGVIEVIRTEPRRGAVAHFYGFNPAAARAFFDLAQFATSAAQVAGGDVGEGESPWAVAA